MACKGTLKQCANYAADRWLHHPKNLCLISHHPRSKSYSVIVAQSDDDWREVVAGSDSIPIFYGTLREFSDLLHAAFNQHSLFDNLNVST